jgi:predicted Zn-dependent protease
MLSGIILLLTILVISSSVIAVNADVFKTLKLKQPDRPSVCIFEPSTDTTDNWELLKVATLMGIYSWDIKLNKAYPDGDWNIKVHDIIPWEEHEHKSASDYKQCNIMINFEKTNEIENSNAIGTTSIHFNNSNHKYMFINVYLEHKTLSNNSKIVIGEDSTVTFKISLNKTILTPNLVRNIVLHEMGHALGLEHYSITTPLKAGEHGIDRSSMYYSININDNQQMLEVKQPEILLLKEIYGADGWLGSSPLWNIRNCTVINSILLECE